MERGTRAPRGAAGYVGASVRVAMTGVHPAFSGSLYIRAYDARRARGAGGRVVRMETAGSRTLTIRRRSVMAAAARRKSGRRGAVVPDCTIFKTPRVRARTIRGTTPSPKIAHYLSIKTLSWPPSCVGTRDSPRVQGYRDRRMPETCRGVPGRRRPACGAGPAPPAST